MGAPMTFKLYDAAGKLRRCFPVSGAHDKEASVEKILEAVRDALLNTRDATELIAISWGRLYWVDCDECEEACDHRIDLADSRDPAKTRDTMHGRNRNNGLDERSMLDRS